MLGQLVSNCSDKLAKGRSSETCDFRAGGAGVFLSAPQLEWDVSVFALPKKK